MTTNCCTDIGKDWWTSRENAISTVSQRKNSNSITVQKRPAENPIGTRKYRTRQLQSEIRVKKPKNKNPEKTQQTVHRETNRSDTPTKHGNVNELLPKAKNFKPELLLFRKTELVIRNKYARYGDHNATIAKRCDILPRCATPRPLTG